MKVHDFYFPKDEHQRLNGSFSWYLGPTLVHARSTSFLLRLSPPPREHTWFLTGTADYPSTGDYFYFQIGVDYVSEEVMDASYTLEGGFSFRHTHSIPGQPGWFQSVRADSAELTIRLDPVGGTAKGNFTAHFNTDGYDMHPTGTFDLIRDDMKN
ncbi:MULTISPECIES: hypothetical protein [unclassified Pseudomonas]|uniref:hypothetical protein n=1 Tax=unclassified Pseudomonas TaxID=196821 RepID=UPI0008713B0F|nr:MULTISPECIES: hypothetical protein [unclassified Pseudomonas]SCW65301.1 hypothetical protein SAMN03159424_02265 [Pseudomonas sp. NFACC05-1]SCZ41081.1 hypothetical protein SAMN03159405_04468 [Pseudomonas sp. NFACC44-2]SDA89264.1 hypothetical protein SAMN03159429_05531 [Pseudomonas sp. NFACC51]SDX28592.1 hypothetical protein SAMN03159474_02719 [Pseudomonas sp. NFACC08-1]SEJ96541.1 hypothetical protein SAMN03159298_05365 [Pseudomonas sp. NFACC07-1]